MALIKPEADETTNFVNDSELISTSASEPNFASESEPGSETSTGSDGTSDQESIDVEVLLPGECVNSADDPNCQPACFCAEGFNDCNEDSSDGCETEGECL